MNLSKPELDKNEIQGQYYLVIYNDIYLKAQLRKYVDTSNSYIKIYHPKKSLRNKKIGSINLYKFNEDLIGKPIFPEKIKERELNKDYLVNYQDTFYRTQLQPQYHLFRSHTYIIKIYDCKSRTLLKAKKLDRHLFKFTQYWEGKNLDKDKTKYMNNKNLYKNLKELFTVDERADCLCCFDSFSYKKHTKQRCTKLSSNLLPKILKTKNNTNKSSSKLISNRAVRSSMRLKNLPRRYYKEDDSDYDTEIQSDSDCDIIDLTCDDEHTSSRIKFEPFNQKKKSEPSNQKMKSEPFNQKKKSELSNQKMKSELSNQEKKDEKQEAEKQDELSNQKMKSELSNQKMKSELSNQEMKSEPFNQKKKSELSNQKMKSELSNQEMKSELSNQEKKDEKQEAEKQDELSNQEKKDEKQEAEKQDELSNQEKKSEPSNQENKVIRMFRQVYSSSGCCNKTMLAVVKLLKEFASPQAVKIHLLQLEIKKLELLNKDNYKKKSFEDYYTSEEQDLCSKTINKNWNTLKLWEDVIIKLTNLESTSSSTDNSIQVIKHKKRKLEENSVEKPEKKLKES